MFKSKLSIPTDIMAVGISTLLVAISSTAAFSITPFFMHDVLGINLLAIGLIESITESLSQFSRLFSGVICDKMRRCKPMYVIGTAFSFIAKPLLCMATGSSLVIASKVSDRLGNGLSATPRDQYVALHSTDADRGANIGLTMTFKTIGCVLGPFLVMGAMWLFGDDVNLRTLLIATSIPAFLAVFVAMKYINETGETIVKSREKFELKALKKLSLNFWAFVGIMFIFMLARAPECYLLLNLKHSGLPQWFCTGAIGFFNLVSVFISYPAGRLSDKFGRKNMLLLSFAALVASTACFATDLAVFGVIGVIFWGVQRASSQIISVACIADMVDKAILGSAIGILNVVGGVAGMLASCIAGLVSERYGIAFSYFVSTCAATLACVLLLLLNRSNKK